MKFVKRRNPNHSVDFGHTAVKYPLGREGSYWVLSHAGEHQRDLRDWHQQQDVCR